jgi:hypothetical protein
MWDPRLHRLSHCVEILHYLMRVRWETAEKLRASCNGWDLRLGIIAGFRAVVRALTIPNQIVNVYCISTLFLPRGVIRGTLD